jgi:hypothetical protein
MTAAIIPDFFLCAACSSGFTIGGNGFVGGASVFGFIGVVVVVFVVVVVVVAGAAAEKICKYVFSSTKCFLNTHVTNYF